MKALLENIAAMLAAASAAILAMSWSHEYGYFSTIGRQFQTFLTTGDYITNGALWLPLAVLFIYQGVSWGSLAVDPKETKVTTNRWLGRIIWVLYFAWVAFIVAVITWPVDYSGAAVVLGFVVLFWSKNWRTVYAKFSLEEPVQLVVRELVRLGPPILIGMYLYGSVNAADDLTRTDNVYLFKFRDEKAHPQLYVFLRNFERGVLARDAVEKRVVFLKWDDIKEVSLTAAEKTNSLGCWLLGLGCSERYKTKVQEL
jgi:hypothetical protein